MSLSAAEAKRFTLQFWEDYCMGSAEAVNLSCYFSKEGPASWIGTGEGEIFKSEAEIREALVHERRGMRSGKRQISCEARELSDDCILVCGEICFEDDPDPRFLQSERLRFTAVCCREGAGGKETGAGGAEDRVSGVGETGGGLVFRHLHISVPDYLQIDSLTGLRNRINTENKVNEYLEMAEEEDGLQRALLMVDIDNFKEINDSRGHLFGDRVLKVISARLRETGADGSVVTGRIGGDEFLLFFKEPLDREAIRKRAETIRDCVLHLSQEEDFRDCRISITVGVALAPQDGQLFHQLLDKADSALYWGKSHGKNVCRFYDEISV